MGSRGEDDCTQEHNKKTSRKAQGMLPAASTGGQVETSSRPDYVVVTPAESLRLGRRREVSHAKVNARTAGMGMAPQFQGYYWWRQPDNKGRKCMTLLSPTMGNFPPLALQTKQNQHCVGHPRMCDATEEFGATSVDFLLFPSGQDGVYTYRMPDARHWRTSCQLPDHVE